MDVPRYTNENKEPDNIPMPEHGDLSASLQREYIRSSPKYRQDASSYENLIDKAQYCTKGRTGAAYSNTG